MWQYVGNGSGTNGIPMRDLTDDEWNAIPKWLRDIALGHGFYANVTVTVPDVVDTAPANEGAQPPLDDKPAAKRKAK
jgi:hypothetical protein